MKTSVEIDDSKLELIRKMDTAPRTREEIIDMALEELLNSMRRQRLVEMRGTGWDGDLDEMRTYDVPLI